MSEHHDTVIVGGGQAGLAMSYHLRQRGREHVILERGRIADRWRNERWKSLRFQFPNWSIQLPGSPYTGADPEGFAHFTEIVHFIDTYAANINAPVKEGTEAISVSRESSEKSYLVETRSGNISTRNVIIATGPFQSPYIPSFGRHIPSSVFQVSASQYKSPDQLPPGAVLVVGSGASGCQIADELHHAGRTVYLSASRHRRVPRRYRGKDMFWWSQKLGRFDITIDAFPDRKYPPSTVVTGVRGGYDLDLRQFARDGVRIIGHVRGVSEGAFSLASDAAEILEEADKANAAFISAADELAARSDLNSLLEAAGDHRDLGTSPGISQLEELDLRIANIGSVVWATGHRFDFSWVRLPIFDTHGVPIQKRGISNCEGVYFLGLHWMQTFKSGLLSFVGDDAAYLADYMERNLLG